MIELLGATQFQRTRGNKRLCLQGQSGKAAGMKMPLVCS